LFAIAVGAILKFAVTAQVAGISISTVDPDGGGRDRPDRQPVVDPGRPRCS
jgi:hypothetical protein